MKTEWLGLWGNYYKNGFVSQALTQKQIKALPKKCKIYVNENQFYEEGGNKPKFVFCFSDAKDADEIHFSTEETTNERVERLENVINETVEQGLVPLENAIEVAIRLLRDMEYGYSIDDLQVEARGFMKEHCVSKTYFLTE